MIRDDTIKYATFKELHQWSQHSPQGTYAATVDEVARITDRGWSTGHVNNLLTILNGVRSLGELAEREEEIPTNKTQYEHHDLEPAPYVHAPLKPRPKHRKRMIKHYSPFEGMGVVEERCLCTACCCTL